MPGGGGGGGAFRETKDRYNIDKSYTVQDRLVLGQGEGDGGNVENSLE